MQNQSIELTMIFVPDGTTGRFSAFFAQFPEAIAVGQSEDDAEKRLLSLFSVMMNDRKEETFKELDKGQQYIQKQTNLVFA